MKAIGGLDYITDTLTKQLHTVIEMKKAYMASSDHQKVAVFRDFEKQIENCLDILTIGNKKKEPTIKNSELREISTLNFTSELTKIIDATTQPIFTNTIIISILERLNATSEYVMELQINLSDLRDELSAITNNDFVPKDSPLISYKSLKAFETSFLEAKHLGENNISISILFLSILKNKSDITTKVLNQYGINYNSFFNKVIK